MTLAGVAAPEITPATQTVTGQVGTAIPATTAYTPSGFTGAVSYAISPALPAGLSLNTSTGVISGTPTATQAATSHTVTGTGATSGTATATVSITIAAAPALTPATQTVTGQVGTAIPATTAYTATGFTGAVSYTISPALPAGLSLNASTGVISGTPTATQATTSHTVTGTGATSGTATATVSVTVLCPATVVTTTADSGAGSLRQTIADACPDSTITFASDLAVQLTSAELLIGKNLTIDGTGHAVSINGSGSGRVLEIADGGHQVALRNLTIANGTTGSFQQGGGLLIGNSTVTVTNAAFLNNSAFECGAVSNSGVTVLNNVTFAGNGANGRGSALCNNSGSVTLNNVTVAGNNIPVALHVSGGTVTLNNTLLANNAGGNCTGTITDGGHNLEDGATCAFSAANSLGGTNPLLGALGNYGGDTQTLPLLPGSPAIDAGNATVCADAATVNSLDQRGIARPQGAACDIGALESRGFTLAKTGGDDQSATVSTAFADPLAVSVTATGAGEPVDGGQVTFTAPVSGASAALAGSPATIAGGSASANATANATAGSYQVATGAAGATTVNFSLTNTDSVGKTATTTALTGHGPDPALTGQAVTVTYTVTPATGPGVPTGSVTIDAATGETCTASVATGACDLTFATAGQKTLTATYPGDTTFAGSVSAPQTQQIDLIAQGTVPGGSGMITARGAVSDGTAVSLTSARFLAAQGDPASPPDLPPGISFPYGLFAFTVTGLPTTGTPASVTFTLTYPDPLPAGARHWKYGPTTAQPTPHWYVLPAAVAGNRITFTVTDGGPGDSDLSVDGAITDPGGPGVGADATDIPTLDEWALLLLGLALAGLAWRERWRRAWP